MILKLQMTIFHMSVTPDPETSDNHDCLPPSSQLRLGNIIYIYIYIYDNPDGPKIGLYDVKVKVMGLILIWA